MSVKQLLTTNVYELNCNELDVVGDLAIGGETIMGGNMESVVATPSNSSSTGALVLAGGMGVGGAVHLGGSLFVPTTGGTATGLSYFSTARPELDTDLGGGVTDTIFVHCQRLNNLVTVTLPVTAFITGAGVVFSIAAIPVAYRPVVASRYSCVVDNGGDYQHAVVLSNVDGTITIAPVTAIVAATGVLTIGVFNPGVPCHLQGVSISYYVE